MTGQLYRHFRGGLYEIVCGAHDSEDRDRELIVYSSLRTTERDGRTLLAPYGIESGIPSPQFRTWVRPKTMFFEHVERDGYSGPRFRPVKLKPIDVCRRCNHAKKTHLNPLAYALALGAPVAVYERFAERCRVKDCACDCFDPEHEVVEVTDGVPA